MMATHTGLRSSGVVQYQQSEVHGGLLVDHQLAAVLLTDGKWYTVEDPTLPQGTDGYLSFLQHSGTDVIMVNVAVADIKAASYYGVPEGIEVTR